MRQILHPPNLDHLELSSRLTCSLQNRRDRGTFLTVKGMAPPWCYSAPPAMSEPPVRVLAMAAASAVSSACTASRNANTVVNRCYSCCCCCCCCCCCRCCCCRCCFCYTNTAKNSNDDENAAATIFSTSILTYTDSHRLSSPPPLTTKATTSA